MYIRNERKKYSHNIGTEVREGIGGKEEVSKKKKYIGKVYSSRKYIYRKRVRKKVCIRKENEI